MRPVTLRPKWRTRVREAVAACFTFAAGVVAATAGVAVLVRVVAGAMFLVGAYALLDALILTASWRLTATGLKIPTLISRKREISGGPELTVTPGGGVIGCLVVAGPRGTRYVNVNPLVSPSDLRAWFAEIGE